MIETSLQNVKDVLKAHLSLDGMNIDGLTEESSLFGDGLGLDSLDVIELVIILRKQYDIVIENMTQGREVFKSMGSLRKYIEENRKK